MGMIPQPVSESLWQVDRIFDTSDVSEPRQETAGDKPRTIKTRRSFPVSLLSIGSTVVLKQAGLFPSLQNCRYQNRAVGFTLTSAYGEAGYYSTYCFLSPFVCFAVAVFSFCLRFE